MSRYVPSSSEPIFASMPGLVDTVKPPAPHVGQIYYDVEKEEQFVWTGADWTPLINGNDSAGLLSRNPSFDDKHINLIIEFLIDKNPYYETFSDIAEYCQQNVLNEQLSEFLTTRCKTSIVVFAIDATLDCIRVQFNEVNDSGQTDYDCRITNLQIDEYFRPTSLIFDQTRNIEAPKLAHTAGIDIATSGSGQVLTFVNHSDSGVTISLPSSDSFNIDERFKELTFMTEKYKEEVTNKILDLETKINKKPLWQQSILNIYTTLKENLGFGNSKKRLAAPETHLPHS